MKNQANTVMKKSIIPELVSGSSTHAVTKLQALKTLKKFQGLSNFITTRGVTAHCVISQCLYAGYSGGAGFTLIELLVVVLIIGILAAVAVPQYQVAVAKSRYAALLPMADAAWQAAQLYRLEHGEWPSGRLSDFDIGTSGVAYTNRPGTSTETFVIQIGNDKIRIMYASGKVERFCLAPDTDTVAKKACSQLTGTANGKHMNETNDLFFQFL